ncbi:MAG: hypothetical protein R2942_04050 [Ignavibacteria bacterium]
MKHRLDITYNQFPRLSEKATSTSIFQLKIILMKIGAIRSNEESINLNNTIGGSLIILNATEELVVWKIYHRCRCDK